jgi:hypothetical protein
MEVLLEVVLEREVDERPLVGRQLHRGGESALHDRKVAGRQVLVEIANIGPDLEAVVSAQLTGVDARPGHGDHPQLRDEALGLRVARNHPPQQIAADTRPTDGDDADTFVGAVAELGA